MNLIRYPEKKDWDDLCRRPIKSHTDIKSYVHAIMQEVKRGGDTALYSITKKIDKVDLHQLNLVLPNAVSIPEKLEKAIAEAKSNIEKFHYSHIASYSEIETKPGVRCWRKSVAIERVGLYIPGGTAPLFSSLLMLGIPATLAGCREIIICTPPNKDGKADPVIQYVAKLIGIEKIFCVGGAHAIAAMTFGTETIPKVDKIFGPGNQYVTMAKQLAQEWGVAIDMPAGPSEVLIIADTSANPEYIAADLLSQAEHGIDSQVVLLTDSEVMLKDVLQAIVKQLEHLPRKDIAKIVLQHSMAILTENLDQAMSLSNHYAPEHLILATQNPRELAEKVINAGSVFLGHYSCESAGDYASGTNHTLPTNGWARTHSGISVDSFVKEITFQELSPEGLKEIGPAIETMAEAEGLEAHKYAVTIRLKDITDV